ncbi:putative dehydrogenase [Candidatus Methanoperedens nitroreducens]|uniref:Putative dehydrogenase n=1 Tax=Candidatus Methanoperedens nitratireducens TaxID=1392998 RepID=A0A062V8N2_9EURY|nr:Gfo/Idh/MocA family oxidoreductase [Candidatus Methanoperedens nitroreducens]KCZ71730.1 putative dehydrogenase [Candidatus Methanoperedens nitroreducens]MDJ1422297.1 Gfo/Idh/MocA family oxidoreductase [Candidatus Methanoperedens sp.]
MKKIKLAIIGCGAVAEVFHIPTLQRMPEFEIVALVDANEERAKELKNKYSLNCETFSDYKKVLSKDIDAVFILTPPKFHSQIAIECAEAGKHIFCEKPMETSLEKAKDMVEASEKAGVKLMVGLNFRFIPQFKKVHELIEKGFLGHLIGASSTFFTNASVWPSKSKFQYSREGGGALFEMGCHHMDLIRWYLGDIRNVFGNIKTLNKDITIDDTANVYMEFKNGAAANLAVVWGDLSINEIRVYGDGGFIYANGSKNEVLFTPKGVVAQAPIRIKADKKISAYHEEFRHFFECIMEDRTPVVNGTEGYKTLESTLAAYESYEKGIFVEVTKK